MTYEECLAKIDREIGFTPGMTREGRSEFVLAKVYKALGWPPGMTRDEVRAYVMAKVARSLKPEDVDLRS